MLALDSSLIRATLDALLSFLTDRIGAGFGQTKLDTALARSTIIALFASLLAVDCEGKKKPQKKSQ